MRRLIALLALVAGSGIAAVAYAPSASASPSCVANIAPPELYFDGSQFLVEAHVNAYCNPSAHIQIWTDIERWGGGSTWNTEAAPYVSASEPGNPAGFNAFGVTSGNAQPDVPCKTATPSIYRSVGTVWVNGVDIADLTSPNTENLTANCAYDE